MNGVPKFAIGMSLKLEDILCVLFNEAQPSHSQFAPLTSLADDYDSSQIDVKSGVSPWLPQWHLLAALLVLFEEVDCAATGIHYWQMRTLHWIAETRSQLHSLVVTTKRGARSRPS